MSDDNIMAVEPEDEAVPMESSEDAPAAEDDQTTGDGSTGTSDVASGDGDEDESKSVSTTTNNTNAPAEEDGVVGEEDEDEEEEDDAEQKSVGSGGMEEEDAEEETKSVAADENDNDMEETETAINEPALETASPASTPAVVAPPVKKKRGKPQIPASARKGRAPAVKGLNIPFRTVKKAMKLDPDIPIVQNEAAIMTTLAAELFLKRLADESQKICKNRGKNTIRYEDVADARANDPSLAFLKTIIP